MSKKGDYKIPFRDGSLQHYPQDWPHSGVPLEWRDNGRVSMALTYQGYRRGRSAAYIEWRDAAGKTFPMFLTDLDAVIRGHSIERGTVAAEWTFCKRGQNYGICLVAP